MSYSLTRGTWEVCWRGSDGRQRSRRFGDDERAAQAFDEAIHDFVGTRSDRLGHIGLRVAVVLVALVVAGAVFRAAFLDRTRRGALARASAAAPDGPGKEGSGRRGG